MEFAGELAALGTAACWTVTSLAFEAAGKRVGSMPVNIIRLMMAFLLLGVTCFFTRGWFIPWHFSGHAWTWLSISGFVGFFIGDLCLFRAFVVIGPRLSMLIMSLVPAITAWVGWLILGETLGILDVVAMGLTMSGVAWVVFERPPNGQHVDPSERRNGILLALIGTLGQAVGLVLSKHGLGDYDAFSATQIRIMAGAVGFFVLFTLTGQWTRVWSALKQVQAMKTISIGAVAGPYLGVTLSLVAVKHAKTGVAATIMSIVPIMIIPAVVLLYRESVSARAVMGAVMAVMGVGILFL